MRERGGDPAQRGWHPYTALQGWTSSGENRTAPALCTATLRGIAAQRAREGWAAPADMQRRLEAGT
eukprot:8823233-Alexandrium_andersonii.AAC.1